MSAILHFDLNQAQVLVQNRVNAVLSRLPEEVRRLGVTAQKRSPDLTLAAQFFSPDGSRDVSYLANYVTLQVQNEIARLPGVAEASMLGVTLFGLLFTPVFYVVIRRWVERKRPGGAAVPHIAE